MAQQGIFDTTGPYSKFHLNVSQLYRHAEWIGETECTDANVEDTLDLFLFFTC